MTSTLSRAIRHIAAISGRLEEAATPRTLYLSRNVLNAEEIGVWAREQGFEDVKPELFHVTIAYSKAPVNWMKLGSDYYGNVGGTISAGDPNSQFPDGSIVIGAGGPRLIERFDGGAVVLLFACDSLTYRNQRVSDIGGSWDHPTYQPHITLAYDEDNTMVIDTMQAYQGRIVLGPEVFAVLDEDWKEKNYEKSADELAASETDMAAKLRASLKSAGIKAKVRVAPGGGSVQVNQPAYGVDFSNADQVKIRQAAVSLGFVGVRNTKIDVERNTNPATFSFYLTAFVEEAKSLQWYQFNGVANIPLDDGNKHVIGNGDSFGVLDGTVYLNNPNGGKMIKIAGGAMLKSVMSNSTKTKGNMAFAKKGVEAALASIQIVDPEANYCVQPDGSWAKEGSAKYDCRAEPIKGKDLPADAECSNSETASWKEHELATGVVAALGNCAVPFLVKEIAFDTIELAASFAVGDKIEVVSDDGEWYKGKVQSVKGNKVSVVYDGEKEAYPILTKFVRVAGGTKAKAPTKVKPPANAPKFTNVDYLGPYEGDGHPGAGYLRKEALRLNKPVEAIKSARGKDGSWHMYIDPKVEGVFEDAPMMKPSVRDPSTPENNAPAFPKEQRSATKTRNHMVKQYGLKPLRNYTNNPYSDVQTMEGLMSNDSGAQMVKDLVSQGYVKTGRGKSLDLRHPNGGHITVGTAAKGAKTYVTIYGDKKAKPTTIPYYD